MYITPVVADAIKVNEEENGRVLDLFGAAGGLLLVRVAGPLQRKKDGVFMVISRIPAW